MALGSTAYFKGDESADTFFRRTRGDWERLARYVLKRWPPPRAVEEGDLVQEMMLHAWSAMPKCNPSRIKNTDNFVIFSAVTRAKRWLHRQRGAPRGSALPAATVISVEDLGERALEAALSSDADATGDIERDSELRSLIDGLADIKTAICLVAVYKTKSVARAGDAIYEDPTLRRQCRLDCRDDARRTVAKEIKRAELQVSAWRSS
jgi:DNA-directed RNA polymerase specialized sigma24 family protein